MSDQPSFVGHSTSREETERAPWVMPEWMEPFRRYVEADCGGRSAESLLNDTKTNGFNNVIVVALISMCDTKVRMLHALKRDGLLVVAGQENPSDG